MTSAYKISPKFISDVQTVYSPGLPTFDTSSYSDATYLDNYTLLMNQYISAGSSIPAEVVQTYSLLYTNILAYQGGVVDVHGDIHFIPNGGEINRGQKISVNGVINTYSLVYTANINTLFSGGVLAPNGDIHFVPALAAVGQKISADGVVSTYSLAATGLFHIGGMLGPNGDIHFVLGVSTIGQKISVDSGYLPK